jgi:hypothetical protein
MATIRPRVAVFHIHSLNHDQPIASSHSQTASKNFLCFDLFAGRADEDELYQTRPEFWDRPEVLHGVAARGAY